MAEIRRIIRTTLRASAIGAVALTAVAGVAAVAALTWASRKAHAQHRQPAAIPGGPVAGEQPAPTAASLSRLQRPGDPFLPSRHGFAFANHFTGSSLPPELRDAQAGLMLWARRVAETYANLPDEFGLCGGMSLSAADHYAAGAAIPDSQAAPAQGTPLYDAIYQRQRDSLGSGARYVLKFAHWMALPDIADPAAVADAASAGGDAADGQPADEAAPDDHAPAESTSTLTRLELPAICRSLDRGELVPLGLVLTRTGRGKLWHNHQVLAYRLERPDDATLHVFIYDPNYPGDDGCYLRVEGIGVGLMGLDDGDDATTPTGASVPTIRPGEPSTTGEMVRTTRLPTRGTPRAVRGLFPMPWEPAAPAIEPEP